MIKYPYGKQDPYAQIELVAATQMIGDKYKSDQLPVLAARVSHSDSGKTGVDNKADIGLMGYLAKHKHMTPFEAQSATFRIVAPIFVIREWFRHRTQCLSGDTNIMFYRPCDKKPYYKTLRELSDTWNMEDKPVKRLDKQKRTLKQFKRDTIMGMQLPCINAEGLEDTTSIIDVIESGEKEVFEIKTSNGKSIKASKDHKFLTNDGWTILANLVVGSTLKSLGNRGDFNNESNILVPFSKEELDTEVWVSTEVEGYDVSSIGRVRSFFRQGSNAWSEEPVIKKITSNSLNRGVVSINNKAHQVSTLVAKGFLDYNPEFYVLHIDDNALNNRVNNLYMGTSLDNAKDRIRNNRQQTRKVIDVTILSIDYVGLEETYDLTVAHKNHNFFGDWLCTHNSFNESSMRYTSDMVGKVYLPEEWRKQATRNKQSSSGTLNTSDSVAAYNICTKAYKASIDAYNDMLDVGVCREQARIVVPVGNYSEFYVTANLRNWYNFWVLRSDSTAQWEIRQYSDKIADILRDQWPNSWKSLESN